MGRAVVVTDCDVNSGTANIYFLSHSLTSKSRVRNLKPYFIQPQLASATARPYFAMSSSEDSEARYTDYEYEIEAENLIRMGMSLLTLRARPE